MKSTLLVSILLLIFVSCRAQLISDKFECGLVAGNNFSSYSGMVGAKLNSNFSFGLYSRHKLGKQFTINPRIFFKYNGGATGLTLTPPSPNLPTSFDTTDVKRTSNYVSAMVSFNFHFTPWFSAGLGPQFMILTGAKDVYNFNPLVSSDQLLVDAKHLLHAYDAGITAGVNFNLANIKNLTIGVWYYYGLMYVVKDESSHVKNSVLQVWVGIPIVRPKETK